MSQDGLREIAVDAEKQHQIEQFLYREAALLDRFEMEAWLDLVSEDILLEVPVRSDRGPGSDRPTFSDETFYLRDEYEMLCERVDKLSKEYAWSENPRSRVRHVIGNVRVTDSSEGEYSVRNNQFVYRSQGDTAAYAMLAAQRDTRLTEMDGAFEITNRTVYLDHSILTTKNITLALL